MKKSKLMLVAFLGLILLIVSVYALFPSIIKTAMLPVKGLIDQRIVVGLSFNEVIQDDFEDVNVPQWQQDYYYKLGVSPVVASLDYIYIPYGIRLSKNFCIQSVTFNVLDVPNSAASSLLDKTVCFADRMKYGMNYFFINPGGTNTYIYSSISSPFLFPFDSKSMKIILSIEGNFITEDGILVKVNPRIQSVTNPPRWITSNVSTTQRGHENGQTVESAINFIRPPIYQFLSVVLPITVIVLIIILHTQRTERDSFGEITVGFTLGLWGISEVLIPSYIDYPTLIGSVILFLYLPLAISVMRAYWIFHNRRNTAPVEENKPAKPAPKKAKPVKAAKPKPATQKTP